MMKSTMLAGFVLAMLGGQSQASTIEIASCDAKQGVATVTISDPPGSWVEFSYKIETRNGLSEGGDIVRTFVFGLTGRKRFELPLFSGPAKVRATVWKGYNGGLYGFADDTGWVSCQ